MPRQHLLFSSMSQQAINTLESPLSLFVLVLPPSLSLPLFLPLSLSVFPSLSFCLLLSPSTSLFLYLHLSLFACPLSAPQSSFTYTHTHTHTELCFRWSCLREGPQIVGLLGPFGEVTPMTQCLRPEYWNAKHTHTPAVPFSSEKNTLHEHPPFAAFLTWSRV